MVAIQMFLGSQQLEAVHTTLGMEMCRALELLTEKLTEMPRKTPSSRDYAELREARALIAHLKYPDSTEPVRLDELAWALKRVKDAYQADAREEWAFLFDKAAKMLGIDLSQPQPIPADLNRRITNELQLRYRSEFALTLATAV